jgi:gliding motility-associated lipoprotein GldH
MKIVLYFLSFVFLFLLNACNKGRVFDQSVDIDEAQWKVAEALNYDVVIEDPAKEYNVSYYIRYNNEYPFYNLYMTHTLLDSSGKEIFHKLRGMDIFDSKSGEPLGGGFGNVYARDILAFGKYKFPYKGRYTVKLVQSMRKDPLPGITSVGLKIEESNPENK